MTAYSDISSDQALHLGAEAFLYKPVEQTDLLEQVNKALIPKEARWSAPVDQYEGVRTIKYSDHAWVIGKAATPVLSFGQGGMFLNMEEHLPRTFEIIKFEIDSPLLKNNLLSGYGRVRWVRHESIEGFPAGVGIEFLALAEGSRRDFLEYLNEAKPTAFIPLDH